MRHEPDYLPGGGERRDFPGYSSPASGSGSNR